MSISGSRKVQIQLTGDVTYGANIESAVNTIAAGIITVVSLAPGDNVLTVPAIVDIVPSSLTVHPPDDNEEAITLKGDASDVGVQLHNTDPTSLAIHSSVSSIILNAATTIAPVRLYWI